MPTTLTAGGSFNFVSAVGDLDGDGRSDLLAGFTGGGPAAPVFLNTSTGLPDVPTIRLPAPIGGRYAFGAVIALLTLPFEAMGYRTVSFDRLALPST